MATMQTQSISDLNQRIEELSKLLVQNRKSKEILLEKLQSGIQQRETTQVAKESDVLNIWSNQCNGKFNALIENSFLCDSPSQQSINCTSTQEIQNQFADVTPYQTASITIKRKNNLMCFEQYDQETGKTLLGLIDKTVTNNYFARKNVEHIKSFEFKKPISSETIQGEIKISNDISFLIVDFLEDFDFVLGMSGLKTIEGSVDFRSLKLFFQSKIDYKVNVCLSKLDEIEKTKIEESKIVDHKVFSTCKLIENNEITREIKLLGNK